MQSNKKPITNRVISIAMSAAMTMTLLPSTAFTANAASAGSAKTVLSVSNTVIVQPIDVIIEDHSETGLATAAVSFDYIKAELIESDGEVLSELPVNTEDPNIVNANIPLSLAGRDLKLRVYYSETGYVDTEIFHVMAYRLINYSEWVVLSGQNKTATATYTAGFTPLHADVYVDGEFDRSCNVSGNTASVTMTENDADLNVLVRMYYGSGENDYVSASTYVSMAYDYEFVDSVFNTVIPENEHEAKVCGMLSFSCNKIKVFCGDKVVYASPANDYLTWAPVATISDEYIGQDLFMRAYYTNDYGYEGYVDSSTFRLVRANTNYHFTKQPNDIDVTNNQLSDLTWEVDFAPVMTEIIFESCMYTPLDEPTQNFIGAEEFMSDYGSGYYRVRTYYGSGDQDYIESSVFNCVAPEFTIQPVGGYVADGKKLKVEWKTNFKPIYLALYADDEFVKELDPASTSIELDGKDVNVYEISAKYSNNIGISSYSFSVIPTTKKIYTVTADKNVYLYNMTISSLSRTAEEGDEFYVYYLGERGEFVSWNSAASGVTFVDPKDIETSFFMPGKNVTIKYITSTSDHNGLRGDVNGDGSITVTDLSKAAALVKGKKTLSAEEAARADVNGDGSVTVSDISRIAAHIKGKKSIS